MRWHQLGLVDMFLLMTIAGVIALMCRPGIQGVGNEAAPWLCGAWTGDRMQLWLYPDGYYGLAGDGLCAASTRKGWTVRRVMIGTVRTWLLECGTHRWLCRVEWGTGFMDVLNNEGSVESRFIQAWRMEGSTRDGKPHGIWRVVYSGSPGSWGRPREWLEYKDGELVDCRDENGKRDLVLLNELRSDRGLPPVTGADSSD
jgi:hypothetical protein